MSQDTKTTNVILAVAVVALVALITVALFDFQVTEPAELPEVEVSGGELPEAKIRGPKFDVETTEKSIEIPTDVDVSVKTERKGFKIPTDVEFELPEDHESTKMVN